MLLKLPDKLKPDFTADLTELPLDELRDLGVKVLAFDLDDTLSHARTRELSPHALKYLKHCASDYRLFIASNAMEDITHIGEKLGATVIPAKILSRKPMKNYFRRLIKAAGHKPEEIAIIGNRTWTDVLGGNRSGLVTVKTRLPDHL